MKPLQPASYSLTWANDVVKHLKNKHARGAEIVEEMLRVTPKQLALYLAKNDPLWKELRNLIKISDNWYRCAHRHYTDVEYIKFIQRNVIKLPDFKGSERLTRRLDELKLKKQVEGERGGGLRADPSQLFFFDLEAPPDGFLKAVRG
jgi:hypothetical protein